jgi:hypothetical protein
MKGFILGCMAYLVCGMLLIGSVTSLIMGIGMIGYGMVVLFFLCKGLIFDLHSLTACGDLCPR